MNIRSAARWLCAFILAGMAVSIPFQSTSADTGPKPSMDFIFVFKINPEAQITSGTLLECSDAACANAESLKQLGPQHFDCSNSTCSSMAYSYSQYQRLILDFSDGVTRTSNVFTKSKFAAEYKVSVYSDHLEVVEQSGGASWPVTGSTILDLLIAFIFICLNTANFAILTGLIIKGGRAGETFKSMSGWYIAGWTLAIPSVLISIVLTSGLIPTLLVELILGVVYAIWRKLPKALFLTVLLLLNLITQPALWLTVSGFSGRYPIFAVLIAEMVVWLAEAAGISLALRKRIGFGEALLVSLVLNAASFGIGLLLPL